MPVVAADWSDTALSWRYGSNFAEPYVGTGISKNIVALTHVSGYKYGTNFFNADLLQSDSKDPADCPGFACTGSAQEAYVVYRNTVELSKVAGTEYKFGVVRDFAGTFGFDWNSKNDAGYNSKKRMLVAGPSLLFDVPGLLKVSVLGLWESNAPCTTFPPAAVGFPSSCVPRYDYKTHPALDILWGIPLGATGLEFKGYLDVIAPKGNNEFGGPTSTETHFDGAIMYDVAAAMGGPRATFKMGFEYEYWKNKFGNPTTSFVSATTAGPGATAKTSMIRAEYHF